MEVKNITYVSTNYVRALLLGIALIIVGIVLLIWKGDALKIVIIIDGIASIVIGLIFIYDYAVWKMKGALAMSIAFIIIGAVLMLVPSLIADILMALLALALMAYGGFAFLMFALYEDKTSMPSILNVTVGVIMLIVGVFALLNLHTTQDVVMMAIGALLVMVGALNTYKGYELYKMYS